LSARCRTLADDDDDDDDDDAAAVVAAAAAAPSESVVVVTVISVLGEVFTVSGGEIDGCASNTITQTQRERASRTTSASTNVLAALQRHTDTQGFLLLIDETLTRQHRHCDVVPTFSRAISSSHPPCRCVSHWLMRAQRTVPALLLTSWQRLATARSRARRRAVRDDDVARATAMVLTRSSTVWACCCS
jgi:hypothetical protein